MSANQKQIPSVVPPSQPRYAQGPSFMQRPTTTQRTDGYHVTTPPAFVQQQPTQGNNQVPPLRMPPAGPPTQSSTPPNTDLKIQSMGQQQSMNLGYVPQASVRAPAQNFFSRPPPPPNTQTPRMSGHRQGQPQMFQNTSSFSLPLQLMPPAVYPNAPFYSNSSRPQGYVQGFPMISNPPLYSYSQPQSQSAFYYNAILARHTQPVTSAPQNSTQPPPPNIPLAQPPSIHSSLSKNRRRSRAIPIIDPTTGKDKLSEMYDQESEESLSHPPSGESSARETPQPLIPNPSKDLQVVGKDEVGVVEEIEQGPPLIEHMSLTMYSPQAVQQRYDTLAQSSKLQAATKEFYPANSTPVVSAITDAEEVTINIPNKQKDRESPAKGRKLKDQCVSRENKDSLKELQLKDVSEKSIMCSKEELKQKDLSSINVGMNTTNKDAVMLNMREEKKIQKKDKTLPSNVLSEDASSDSVVVIPSSQPISDSLPNAKSKHNAVQKTKEVPKQPTPQLQPVQQQLSPAPLATEKEAQIVQQTPIIPPPQQAKTTSKTNKIRDLNLKGASKEGTDMDAFNDNASLEDTNANDSNSVNNDYINNTNNVMLNNNSNINASIVNDIKQSETNNIMTIKATSETKCASKSKVDVTNVFKEMPVLEKNLMPLRSLEAEDEPDRVTLDNNKLVQVKNEVNKVPHEQVDCNVSDIKLNLPYKEDQWSPFNQDGKKVYDKEFLLALKGNPKSNLKPDNLPTDIVANEDRGRVGEINRYPMGGRATDFAPTFSNNTYPGKSSSQRGGIPLKRKSQQGSLSGNNKGKQGMIRLSISVREDVKLHESENAWKPARCVASANMTEDEKKTEELYKKVRGVLNKLTPQKFNTLLDQIRNFNIDTTERLQGVIDLVFEKAVDEPNFSVAYAALCGQLALMQVPAPGSNNKDGQQDFVNFRKLLITRCQLEFEKNSIDETERNSKLKEVEECTDPEKKKDLTLDLEDYDRRLRMKSVGNIRFIGELFKQNMLTVSIMMRCLKNLLTTKDEESLECLCKLLTTVGKELESKHENLADLFNAMKELANKKQSKISSRVRFMIQDVIDLRLSKWIPRRQELNPKTMDQIQKEAETEQLNIQAMNSVPLSRRDDRGSVGGGNINANNEKKRRNAGSGESDWSVATSRGNRIQQQFSVKSDKLKIALITPDEPLGNSQMFGNWGRGSNFKLPNQVGTTTNSNMYAPLDGLESDKSSNIGLRSREFVLKGPGVERYNRQPYEEALDGRGSRSGSQHRSRDSSKTSQCNIPTTVLSNTQKSQTNTVTTPLTLSSEKLEVKIRNIVEDYVNEFSDSLQSDEEVKIQIPPAAHSQLVSDGYMLVLERSQTARFKAGTLFAHLIKVDTLSLSNYCIGLETVLAECEELIIDIPMVWLYVAELIVPVLWNKIATFQDLHKPLEVVIQNKRGCKVLSSIFKLFIHKKSPAFLQSCWISSGLRFSDFMQESEVESFLNDGFRFLLQNESDQVSPNHGSTSYGLKKLKYEEIHTKLLSFFKSSTPFDEVTDWINANVGDAVTENQFFRVLTTAIFNYAIVNTKLKNDILQEKFNYFHYFVDNKPNYELQCLFALQSLLHKLEYPQGLLLQIFNKLYEENIFSHESFLSWEMSNDPAEQEGKGVAIKQLTSFFTQLKEADEDSSSSSVEEEMA